MSDDQTFMQRALALAELAAQRGEVPVGALVVRDGVVLGEAYNQPIGLKDATAHAEILALRAASQVCQNYRLPGTTLYVTIEPCTMCVGALMHARVARVVFGALEPKAGALQSRLQLAQAAHWNHQIEVTGGVCEAEAKQLMQDFFLRRREAARLAKGQAADGSNTLG
jgi:tRNA(adenine34) deaminase